MPIHYKVVQISPPPSPAHGAKFFLNIEKSCTKILHLIKTSKIFLTYCICFSCLLPWLCHCQCCHCNVRRIWYSIRCWWCYSWDHVIFYLYHVVCMSMKNISNYTLISQKILYKIGSHPILLSLLLAPLIVLMSYLMSECKKMLILQSVLLLLFLRSFNANLFQCYSYYPPPLG